jgi:hypothetical protein
LPFFCLQKWLLLCMLVDLLQFPAFVLVTSKCIPQLECSILCDGFSHQLIRLKIWWASRTGLKEVLVDLQSFAVTWRTVWLQMVLLCSKIIRQKRRSLFVLVRYNLLRVFVMICSLDWSSDPCNIAFTCISCK